jgi:dipeptidyl aminopeptidase/acylaminoacyl peptidase
MLKPSRLLLVIYVITLCACNKPKTTQIPINDFFKTRQKGFYKISHDGKYISYLKPYKEKRNLFIQSLADGKETMATSFTDFEVRGDYFWTYNDKIVFTQDDIAHDEVKVASLDVVTLKIRGLISEPKVKILFLSLNKKEPDVVTIGMNKRDPESFDIYRLNIKTGDLKTYLINPGNITQWYPDEDGRIRLVKVSDGVDQTILFRPNDGTPFKRIIANNFKTSVKPIAFTGEKNYFYALSNVNRDKSALVEINAEDGKEKKVIFESNSADLQDVVYSKNKHRLDLVSWDAAKPQKHFLNAEISGLYNKLLPELKGNEINITENRDSAENKFIISTYTDRNAGSYYLYEKNSGKLTKLGDNSNLKEDELCTMEPVSFKAGDGLVINGYITYPLGGRKANLPVVVMPHDGPFSHTVWGYNAEVQFLANRGYAVFQVNYRGSTGFGKAFHSAGFKEVGGKMQQDITDGVNWLIKTKTANPKKIAIFGGGFGGFSALYGVSFHPELYNCAIVQHGLINFFTYIKDAPPFLKSTVKMMHEMVGDPEKDAAQLKAISPVLHTDKIKAPLLIFQGAKDQRANISELNQFVSELRKQNGNTMVEYHLKPNERMIFRNERNRREMYAEIEKFLNTNMRVKP